MEPITNQNNIHISYDPSITMSNYSGGEISQMSQVKNENNNIPQIKLNLFNLEKSIQAHDEIIVCMIELRNKLIATGSYDKTIKIWDINTAACGKEIKEEGKVFSLLEFRPNILLIAIDKTPDDIIELSQIKTEDLIINCWDLSASLNKSIFFLSGHQLRVNCLAKCNDNFFANCSNDCNIIIWDYTLRKQTCTLKGH